MIIKQECPRLTIILQKVRGKRTKDFTADSRI